jgi:hypothetical protein
LSQQTPSTQLPLAHSVPEHAWPFGLPTQVPLLQMGLLLPQSPLAQQLVARMQTLPQMCVPPGHVLLQARLLAMQAPLHSCVPPGQFVPHESPSQAAEPPVGTPHALHDVGPQLDRSALLTQAPVPAGHWW